MENVYSNVIGSGVLFPIVLTRNSDFKTGWYPTNGTTDLIISNIESLLNFSIGQRLRQEEFGTRIWEVLEEPNVQAQAFLVDAYMKEALSEYEDRIIYEKSIVSRKGSSLNILLSYRLKVNNASKNLSITYNL